jgi:hypothetical protein
MKAIRKDIRYEVEVRLMDKDEMPDDGITYYCEDDTYIIFTEDELEITEDPNPTRKEDL